MKEKKWIIEHLPVMALTEGLDHFCGFHDIIPWNLSGKYLLALEANPLPEIPRPLDISQIGIVDMSLKFPNFERLAETRAWNWALAARQQWLDENNIIYNDRIDNKFVSIIMDIHTGKKQINSFPIWSITNDGTYGIAPNFSRLHHLYPTYGYAGVDDENVLDSCPDNDGIYLIDLHSGYYELIISILQILDDFKIFDKERDFWVTHPTFNPSGTRFCFYLRFKMKDGFPYSRFFVANRDGSKIAMIAEELISHFAWMDDDNIIVWIRNLPTILSRSREKIITRHFFKAAKLLKKTILPKAFIISGRFYLVNVTNNIEELFAAEVLIEDGHPSFSSDRQWVITDTYPDKFWNRRLILYHVNTGKRIDIAKLHSPSNFGKGAIRCDLHPRWNRKGTIVCIDSTHKGTRQIYATDVTHVIYNYGI